MIDAVKATATERWPEILERVGGIDPAVLDGTHHPCPKCGGKDRFRAFTDGSGGVICSQCFSTKNGDGFSTLQWYLGIDFSAACDAVADYLGIHANGNGNGRAQKPDLLTTICRAKRMPIESAKAYGAHVAKRGKLDVVRFPVCNQKAEIHSHFDLSADGGKGWFAAGKGMSGLFFPFDNGKPRPAATGETWIVCEGVKDATAYHSLGYLASGLPTDQLNVKYARLFCGCNIIIMPDRTTDAEAKSQKSAARLYGVAESVRIGTLPLEIGGEKDDARDVLAMPNGADMLKQAVDDAREWQPPSEIDDTTGIGPSEALIKLLPANVVTNAYRTEADGDSKAETFPLTMRQISGRLKEQTGEWPRRVGQALFIHDQKHGIGWLEQPADLFGWLASHVGKVCWMGGPACISKSELFAELTRTSESYRAIEELPHEPTIEGHYYTCSTVEPGNGDALHELLERFEPATPVDRDLILSAFMTTSWGGPAGCRPAFVITSDDGRGAGKSTIANMIGQLWGGILSFSPKEEIGKIKTRLLSPDALTRRVCLLDNVKSPKFSWGDLEALITAPTIGGHRLFVGEGTRPNTLTWFITLNGASLSTDMAQRAVIIKVKKPKRSAAWEEDTRQFIASNQTKIIADIICALRCDPFTLSKFTRWATWEKDILQRLPDPTEAQKVILERQDSVDVEADEAGLLEEFFAEQLRRLTYNAEHDQVFIPSGIAARWWNWCHNENVKTTGVSRAIRQLIDEGRLKRLKRNLTCSRGRGFVWQGNEADVEEPVRLDIQTRIKHRGESDF